MSVGIFQKLKSLHQSLIHKASHYDPLKLLLFGYTLYIIVGCLALSLPVCWENEPVSFLDNLFISTSAVSTTGLVTVNTPIAYNFMGELVVLILIQFGGLGYMTLGSFVILARKKELPPLRENIARATFSLPDDFSLMTFIRHVVVFTFVIETTGAAFLYREFRNSAIENALWSAIFHSVSAFCTAGFSIFPNSLEDFRNHFGVNLIISVLSILGAVGFLVMSDVWRSAFRANRKITLTTKIILRATFGFLVLGWLLLFLVDPSLKQLPLEERILSSGFQSMTAMTTVGFNTHPIGQLASASVLLMLVLMVIGASPAGTGGGVKSTTISAVLSVMWSIIRRKQDISFLGKHVPVHRIYTAVASLSFYLGMLTIGSGLLLLVQSQAFDDVLFEAASALGTVGLSRGLTTELTALGKLVVIGLMFVGRIGPLTFGLALFTKDKNDDSGQGNDDFVV